MTRLAIIGAGMAGLAAAHTLRRRYPEAGEGRPNLAITVYEKSRRLGGRVASGRRDGYIFDHGAQYAKAPTPELERLLTAELPAEDLRDIGRPVWTFDGAGAIAAGDPAQNADPKWTYRDGLSQLGKLLGDGLDIRHELRIASLRWAPELAGDRATRRRDAQQWPAPPRGQWSLVDTAGQILGDADLILLTPPAPQAAELLNASAFDPDIKATMLSELAGATYRRCISLALAYDRRIERPFYALVNTDRRHPIAWLAFEHDKGPERCPPDHSLLIAQMAPGWSLDHWETPDAELERLVAEHVGALLGEDLRAPLWSDAQRWRYALPDSAADFDRLNGSGSGLFFAGDYTAGQGRVHLAIESGWRVAEAIERMLTQ
jgi:renalase